MPHPSVWGNTPVRCTGGYPYYDSSPGPSSNKHNSHSGEDWVPGNSKGDKYYCDDGNWYLYAPTSGKVIVSKKQTGSYKGGYGAFGNYIVVSCDDGYYVLMAHLQERKVSVGDRVSKGTLLAIGGTTGNSTGRHLHIEVSNQNGVSGGDWWTRHRAHLVCPSSYINFKNTQSVTNQVVASSTTGQPVTTNNSSVTNYGKSMITRT